MPTTRKDALQSLTFGQRVAEEEVKDLAKYLVETEQWRRIASGEIDVVYGPKGSGKTALYAPLLGRADSFFDRNIVMVSGENPRGATVFKDLAGDPPTSEREFINLWKLYFLSLVGIVLREYAPNHGRAKEVLSTGGPAFRVLCGGWGPSRAPKWCILVLLCQSSSELAQNHARNLSGAA